MGLLTLTQEFSIYSQEVLDSMLYIVESSKMMFPTTYQYSVDYLHVYQPVTTRINEYNRAPVTNLVLELCTWNQVLTDNKTFTISNEATLQMGGQALFRYGHQFYGLLTS